MPEWEQRVAAFVDVSNLYYPAVEAYGGHIDYEKFLEFVTGGRKLVRAIAYTVAPLDPTKEAGYLGFVSALKKSGYEVKERRPKMLKRGEEEKEVMAVKANWDMGIAMDAISISLAGKIDVAVIASGDGDFADLAAFLKSHGVKVEVYAFRRNTAAELVKAADEFYDLDEYWDRIAYQPVSSVQASSPGSQRERLEVKGKISPTETEEGEEALRMEEREKGYLTEREKEEILEGLWMLEEEGEERPTLGELEARLSTLPCKVRELPLALEALEGRELVKREGKGFSLTEQGRREAKEVIRRHRLAERLLHDLLEMPSTEMEAGACRLEHALNPEVTDAVCAFLGHPRACPHGKPIPPGPCCERFEREVRPVTLPLSELHPGERARVVFITPSVHARLDRLASLGLIPGAEVKLHQKRPSVVVDVGETQLAIGQEIAREVFVRLIERRREGEG